MTHELQRGAARREQVRMRRPSSLCRQAVLQHVGVVAKGAPIAEHAEAGRMGTDGRESCLAI